jgi:hypothetical protein
MSFAPSRSRPSGRPASGAPVFAVGRRVFVHCEQRGPLVLDDENGHASHATLADGVEVEVIAWRPRGVSGTRYRIRAGADGVDGWVHASNLRTTLAPPPAPAPAIATPEPSPGHRPGERGSFSR